MRSSAVILYATILFVVLSFGAGASSLNICDLSNGNSSVPGGSVQISSQNDVTTKLNGCTTIVGNIHISSNYTGSVNLPGITNITGVLTTYGSLGEIAALAPSLTSISLGDLLYINAIDLNGANLLQALFLPKLEGMESLMLDQYSPLSLTLPSVTSCTQLSLLGNLTSVSIPALRNVSYSFELNTLTLGASSIISIGPPSTVDLPSLIYSPTIDIKGNISSVSLPALALVGSFTITNFGPQMEDLSFPLLTNTTAQLFISGPLSRLSLPSLVGAGSDILIDGNTEGEIPLEIDMPKLENATSVIIGGILSDFDLPALKRLTGSLAISSYNPKFNCTPVINVWYRVNYTSTGDLQCLVVLPTTTHAGLSAKAILGIALGVSIPCILVIVCLGLFWIDRLGSNDQPAIFPLRRLGDRK